MTTQTSLLRLILPVQGEFSGTWGDQVNAGLTNLLDSAIAGTTSLTTDADVTLTANNYSADQSREMILLCTGTRTATRSILAPNSSKIYVVVNATTQPVALKGATGPTTGVTIPASSAALCAWNGSDFVVVSQNNLSTNFTGALPIANGGTGSTSASAALTALGAYPATNPNSYITSAGAPVQSVNGNTGAITAAQISAAATAGYGFTPYANTNPSGYITAAGTAANVSGTVAIANGGTGATSASAALTALGAYPASNPNGYISSVGTVVNTVNGNSGTVTAAQISAAATTGYGFTPYANTNPAGYITSAGTAANVSGTVAIANGGTNGSATPTAGGVAYGTGTAYGFTGAGTAGQILQSNGTSAPSWAAAPSGALKAWINFNGINGSVAINASLGVSSLTRNATADYSIGFTTSFSDTNYSVVGCGSVASGAGSSSGCYMSEFTTNGTTLNRTTSAIRMISIGTTGLTNDVLSGNLAFFR